MTNRESDFLLIGVGIGLLTVLAALLLARWVFGPLCGTGVAP